MGKPEYLRECGVNYLRCPLQDPVDYRFQMVVRNHPGCFLPTELRRIDENEWIYCRINGLLSLRQRLERDRLGERELLAFFESVEQLCRSMEEFLLPFDGLMLDPDYIFVRPDDFRECYWFYGNQSDGMEAEAFLEYLLDHLNFEDQRGVKLMYSIYQTARGCEGGIEVLRETSRDHLSLRREPVVQIYPEARERAPDPVLQTTMKPALLSSAETRKKRNWLLCFREWLGSFLSEKPRTNTREWQAKENSEPTEDTQSTTLLTGGMTGGGIFCLRSRNLSQSDLLLTSYPFFIGKDEKRMDGVVEDAFVSRYHARIDREETAIRVMDLGSTNGTFLNRERLQPYESRVLQEGDILTFAQREYEFCFLR